MTSTFTLTATFTHQDNVTPIVGSPISITADPFPFSSKYQVGTTTVSTDANGQISVVRTTGIAGLYYVVRSMAKTPLFQPVRFLAPTTGTTVDITSLAPYIPGFPSILEAIAEGEADAAASAAAAAASAAAASVITGLTGEDGAVALLVGSTSDTQDALDARYVTATDVNGDVTLFLDGVEL